MKRQLPATLVLFLALLFAALPCAFASDAPEDIELAPSEDLEKINVTIHVEGILLKDVLGVLSEQTGFSYVAGEELQEKRVSLNFDNVPIQDALASIASVNNLRFERKRGSKVILFYAAGAPGEILAVETQTRVFRLKYTHLSISPLEVGGGATIQDLAQQAVFTATTGGSSFASPTSFGSSTGAVPVNLTAARGIDRIIASLLTSHGKITSDVYTNSLIVTDTQDSLEKIEIVLKELDKPSPQVSIEVYLMEVRKNILTDYGMDWGGTNGALASITGGSRTTGFPFTEEIFNQSKGVKATTQSASTLTLGTLSATNFTATLRFLTSDTHTKILARPRILTLNNEAANIRLITNTAIANQTSLTTSQGQANSTTNTAERTPVGVILKMTPQVNEDDSINLFVEPSISTVAASSFFSTTFLDPTTRTVRTLARVKNNQTLVIGGLLNKNHDLTSKKIPFLGDIPLLGHAFRYDDRGNDDRELLIFITPHIVSGYDSFGPEEEAQGLWGGHPSSRRILDNFTDEEMQLGLDSIKAMERQKTSVRLEEQKLREASMDRSLTAAAAEEMTRSMNIARPAAKK